MKPASCFVPAQDPGHNAGGRTLDEAGAPIEVHAGQATMSTKHAIPLGAQATGTALRERPDLNAVHWLSLGNCDGSGFHWMYSWPPSF